MKVYDENWQQLETWDETKGNLHPSIRTIHHEAVEGVEEQGHWETVAEYPETGGKDVVWIIDVPGIEAKQAWDEKQPCYVYKPFTEQELALKEKIKNTPSSLELLEALIEGINNAGY